MSYILDALRRADAERTRGAVPGLHAQNIPADDEPAARNFGPLIWAAGGAGALLVAVVVILVVAPWRAAPGGPVPLAPAPELNPAAGNDAPPTMAQGATPAARPGAIDPAAMPVEPPISRATTIPAASPQPAPAYPPPATTQRLADRAADGRVATLEPRAAAAQALAGRVAPGNGSPVAVANANANANAAAAAAPVEHYGPATAPASSSSAKPARAAAVPNINDLPPATRSELPHLAVGGAIYSESPSERMVILNGQVFHEGDKPAADTVLEQIRLKSAILNWRGQRYEITY